MHDLIETPNKEMIEKIRKLIFPEGTDEEIILLNAIANKRGLDLLTKQIYGIKIKDRMVVMTAIDGLRIIANRSKEYEGQGQPLWYDSKAKEWVDVWHTDDYPPWACKIEIYRSDFKKPIVGLVHHFSSVQHTKYNEPTQFWKDMPEHMLAKCAEAQGLRKAFPESLSGLYSDDEISTFPAQEVSQPLELVKIDPTKATLKTDETTNDRLLPDAKMTANIEALLIKFGDSGHRESYQKLLSSNPTKQTLYLFYKRLRTLRADAEEPNYQ